MLGRALHEQLIEHQIILSAAKSCNDITKRCGLNSDTLLVPMYAIAIEGKRHTKETARLGPYEPLGGEIFAL